MSDAIELEMDTLPALARPTPGLSPLAQALAAMRLARTTDELAAAIVPCRAWPDGPDKDRVRTELSAMQAKIKTHGTSTIRPTPSPVQPAAVLISTAQAGTLARVDAAIALADIEDPTVECAPAAPATDVTGLPALWADLWRTLGQGLMFRRPGADGRAPAAPQALGRVRDAGGGVGAPVRTSAQVGEDTASMRQLVTRRSVVIGAKTEGSGVLLGWSGFGEHTRTGILAALAQAGHPAHWAPSPHSAHAHASEALRALSAGGRVVRAERGVRRGGAGTLRTYVARWTVGDPAHGLVGESMGPVALTAALTINGALDLDGDVELATIVRVEFNRRCNAEVFPAGDVTTWLRSVLIARFYAVRLGGAWYVPHECAPGAEALCQALASNGWGNDWILPALPVATTDQLRAGLTRGLISEAETVLTEFEAQRTSARRDRAGGDIGPRAAATLLARLRDVHDRARDYAGMLGAAYVAPIRARLVAALATIEAQCDDTAQRFAMMDLA